MSQLVKKEYRLPFIMVATLFFLWGFARAIMDVLNKHFQNVMDISISQSTLVQGAFFLGYFLWAIPAGIFLNKYGYRRGMVMGLLIFGLGCLLFLPGERIMSFPFFLFTMFVIASGLVFLEVAANPYMTELGDPETAASRLNLAQSFNGLGNICGPWLGGALLFSGGAASISMPYAVMGIAVVIIALSFSRMKLPEIKTEQVSATDGEGYRSLLHNRLFLFGFIALIFYEIAEISINSLFINYAERVRGIDPATASRLLSFGFLLFMCMRFVGSGVMSRVRAQLVLLICAIGTVVCCALVFLNVGQLSLYALIANYAFEAIMFPTVFSLSLSGLGSLTKRGSSILMLTPIGGAIGTMLMGLLADVVSLSAAFIVPMIGFVVMVAYAWRMECQATSSH
ncbi:MAG: sugar MFS transporter [Bacteroidaceae bacterium]|nr:sugar MFS transporter [Bacteroidaceae bacterium]